MFWGVMSQCAGPHLLDSRVRSWVSCFVATASEASSRARQRAGESSTAEGMSDTGIGSEPPAEDLRREM